MTTETSRTIVCATDLSDASRCALDAAIELCAAFGIERLQVVHVREHDERIENLEGLIEREKAREHKLHQDIDDELAHVKAARGSIPSIEIVTKIRYGKAYREILRCAVEVGADFIVVGTHGRTGLEHAVLGSVAERVVRHAPCNVIVAKSPEVRAHLTEVLVRRVAH
jgi:nucleotide-binding universal stress UspA family protein